MLTALAMTAALASAPAQVGELTITNARPTVGLFGNPRKDADSPKVVPGDAFLLSFDIDGLKVGEDGKVQYSVGMEWTNREGKSLYREEPQPLTIINSLGGMRVPAFAAASTFPDTPPGKYTLTAFVKDRAANTEKKVSKDFEVVAPTFGIVQLQLYYHDDGKIRLYAPPVAVAGQSLIANFAVVGFDRDRTSKLPHVSFKLRVLESGKPVLSKDLTGTIKDAPENTRLLGATFPLYLNRAGKFVVEIEATDEHGKKTATERFDLTVLEPK